MTRNNLGVEEEEEEEEEDHRDGVGDEDQGMPCCDHPHRGNSPGGICGFCLQEKLGNLLSSSSSNFNSSSFLPVHPSSPAVANSSSSSPYAFSSPTHCHAKTRIPFGFSQRKSKKDHHQKQPQKFHQKNHHCASAKIQRSNSTATPIHGRCSQKRSGSGTRSGSGSGIGTTAGGFLSRSLFYLNLKPFSSRSSTRRQMDINSRKSDDRIRRSKAKISLGVTDEIESPNANAIASSSSSFGRKVSRSRSVGCGSRSFSGDFFERISTGFGDCTLRRVESQREGNPPIAAVKERVKCGGIFRGFNLITPSPSSSSSSSYWLSASVEDHGIGKATMTPSRNGQGKIRSWGWTLASPMRVFNKPPPPSSSSRESHESSTNNAIAPSSTPAMTTR